MNDRGFKSRKMIMSYITMLMMAIGFAATAKWPALIVVYGEYCMALIGAASIYCGTNTLVKWAANRAPVIGQKKTALSEEKAVEVPVNPNAD